MTVGGQGTLRWWGLGIFVALYGAAALLVGNSYYQLIMSMVLVWAVLGIAWNMFSGYSGLVSFGHAAFFGLGAYTVGLALVLWNISPWFSIPVAGVVGALAGLLIGIPTFRLRGHYFALAMLAYPLALLYVFEWLGYQEIALPMQRESPAAYMQFDDHRIYIALLLGVLVVAMVLTFRIERSRLGLALRAIRQDELAAQAAGIDTFRCKLIALVLSGALAGAVGGFYAVILLIVTPSAVFGMLVSAQALTVAMFGGAGSAWGPVLGALILVPLSELLHAQFGDTLPGIQGVVYGIAIIVVICVAPEGILWKFHDRRRRAVTAAVPAAAVESPGLTADWRTTHPAPAPDVAPQLCVRDLSRAYGGLKAVQNVGFEVRRGEILGIIGPNGAGKTTLLNLLNGITRPDRGAIIFDGQDIAGWPAHRVCRAGLARTFQVAKPFARMTIADNVLIGAVATAVDDNEAVARAQRALARVGLLDIAQAQVEHATNLQIRLLELARALACQPRLLLLDEIFAGLAAPEIERLLPLVRELAKEGITIVIIEHTMQAMVRLADRFVVLDHGAVLAQGSPAEVTRDPLVIDAYLGRKWRAQD